MSRPRLASLSSSLAITAKVRPSISAVRSPPLLTTSVPETALARAPDHLLDALALANENIPWALDHTLIRKPTLRLVQRGTFSAFRQHRVDEGAGLGQVKVPVVLPKAEYVTWLSERVVCEVGCGFDRTRADVASGC